MTERATIGVPARVRRTVATALCGFALAFALAACGRIPEEVAATLSAPTATPPRPTATARPMGTGGAAGGTTAGGTAMMPAVAFMLAEMPTGNVGGGQTVYMGGCQNCHGPGGIAGGGMQVSLAGGDGLIVSRNINSSTKFSATFLANAAHATIKDNEQYSAPNRLNNMYAYLVMQLGG